VSSHVYTAAKKLSEWQWVAAGRTAQTKHAIARFTHIVDNSSVGEDIHQGISKGVLGLHSPHRHINIQNANQATHLLLNALANADKQNEDRFWVASDIGWPTSVLEIALYEINQSGKDVAVYFLGVPHGYDEHYFYGLYDWTGERDVHALINALESPSSFKDGTGSMLGAKILPFDEALLDSLLCDLKVLVLDERTTASYLKQQVASVVSQIAATMFARIPAETLLRVLYGGINRQVLTANDYTIAEFEDVITVLVKAIDQRLDYAAIAQNRSLKHMLTEVLDSLTGLPALAAETAYMRQAWEAQSVMR
jgi:hypothetical protein